MFTGSLRFNLDPENKATDERIHQLLQEAQLDKFIESDPQKRGLMIEISENGSNLSTGEKQLICICRAILRVSQIIINNKSRKVKLLSLMRQQQTLM